MSLGRFDIHRLTFPTDTLAKLVAIYLGARGALFSLSAVPMLLVLSRELHLSYSRRRRLDRHRHGWWFVFGHVFSLH